MASVAEGIIMDAEEGLSASLSGGRGYAVLGSVRRIGDWVRGTAGETALRGVDDLRWSLRDWRRLFDLEIRVT